MRVLWLTENYPPSRGGMSQSCDRLISNFRRQNVVVDILHFTNRKQHFKTEVNVNGTYTALPKSQDTAHGLNLAFNFVENHSPTDNFDFILAFGGLFPITAAPVFSKLLKLPLYLCIRGNDFDLSIFNFKRRAILTDAVQQSSGVFAVSRDKVKRIESLYTECKAHYTPNGIDTSEWQVLKSEKAFAEQWKQEHTIPGKKILGLFGYLKEKKGVIFFLKALVKSGVKEKFHLLFSGEQEEEVVEYMSTHEITYTSLPFLDRIELIKYYLICDWVTIPSFYDGMPNVMLEAGALGVPVIASAVDGMKDVLTHNENGLLFQPMDENACARILFIAGGMDTQDKNEKGNALKKHILNHYTAVVETENYLKILNKDLYDNESYTMDVCN